MRFSESQRARRRALVQRKAVCVTSSKCMPLGGQPLLSVTSASEDAAPHTSRSGPVCLRLFWSGRHGSQRSSGVLSPARPAAMRLSYAGVNHLPLLSGGGGDSGGRGGDAASGRQPVPGGDQQGIPTSATRSQPACHYAQRGWLRQQQVTCCEVWWLSTAPRRRRTQMYHRPAAWRCVSPQSRGAAASAASAKGVNRVGGCLWRRSVWGIVPPSSRGAEISRGAPSYSQRHILGLLLLAVTQAPQKTHTQILLLHSGAHHLASTSVLQAPEDTHTHTFTHTH
jgi:hypothetical protein